MTTVARETDELTGSRAVLMRDLEKASEPTSPSHTLAIFDLRGYCNSYGTLERDSYLRRLAGQLAEVLPDARFYRPRKDEFAVLVPVPLAIAEPQLARAVSTMTARSGQPQGPDLRRRDNAALRGRRADRGDASRRLEELPAPAGSAGAAFLSSQVVSVARLVLPVGRPLEGSMENGPDLDAAVVIRGERVRAEPLVETGLVGFQLLGQRFG
jgi:GGDEF domain-containing protein